MKALYRNGEADIDDIARFVMGFDNASDVLSRFPKRRVSLGVEDNLDEFTKKFGALSWKQWAKKRPVKMETKIL